MTKNPVSLLVVEDVDEMRLLLVGLLEGVGYAVRQARNVTEARLELQRHRPAGVILDEVLPGESSAALADEMVGLAIPFYLTTGMEDATHRLHPGALGRLPKPTWETLEEDRQIWLKALQSFR